MIHSFWVPQMGGKVDMIPGHVNHIHFIPLTAGTYLGECSEFCGVQHGKMRFLFVVVPPGQYSAWVKRQQQPAAEPAGADAVAGKQVISSVGCGSCHAIRGTTLKGTFGPDLTHFGSRGGIAAYTLTNTPANLLRWIQDPQAVKPACNMPNVPLPLHQQKQLAPTSRSSSDQPPQADYRAGHRGRRRPATSSSRRPASPRRRPSAAASAPGSRPPITSASGCSTSGRRSSSS